MTNPTLITTPFAENGDKNSIPETNTDPNKPQLASMQAGFPPITQQKISDGGIPPERNDFNGILNLYGQHIVHLNKGLPYEFDQAFANSIGGYPLNARLMLSNGDIVQSTVANNTANPNIDMTGWVKVNAASQIFDEDGNSQQEKNDLFSQKTIYLTPEQFGAKGDGIADDTQAIKDCIDFLLINPEQSRKYAIRGYGDYAISSSLLVVNFGFGVDIYLRSIRAHASFPSPTAFNKGTPFFQVGKDAIGGSMVGLNIKCTYVNGGGKATWIDVSGMGCGGSHFHADKLENVVNGVSGIKPNFHSASNKITGGYWANGTGFGVLVEKGDYVVEGWIVDVNFICEFKAGGIVLRDAQYAKLIGQADLNGRYVSELTLSSALPTSRDTTFNNNSNTGIVIASYEESKNVFKVLVYEGRNVLENGSKFAVGAASCNGWSGSVTAIRAGGQGNWFPDVVHDFSGQPFAKCIIDMPYCGGVVGSLLFTSNIQYYNSSFALTNSNNGAQFIHSGDILTLRDTRFNTNVFDATETLLAPFRHLYMNDYRTYGQEIGVTLSRGATTNVFQLLRKNNGTVPSVSEMYKVTCASTDNGLNGEWDVFVNVAGNLYIRPIFENNVTASASGSNFQLAQGALASILCVVNFQRIF